jgi:hypothetical protein
MAFGAESWPVPDTPVEVPFVDGAPWRTELYETPGAFGSDDCSVGLVTVAPDAVGSTCTRRGLGAEGSRRFSSTGDGARLPGASEPETASLLPVVLVDVPAASPVAGFVPGEADSPVAGLVDGAVGSPVAGFVGALLGGGGGAGAVACANAGDAANMAEAATDKMNLRMS